MAHISTWLPSSLRFSPTVDDLLGNAILANQTTHRYTVVVLAGNLLAIGGIKTSRGGTDLKEVYPSTNRPGSKSA